VILAEAAVEGGALWPALSGLGGVMALVAAMWRWQDKAQTRIDVITADQIGQLVRDRSDARTEAERARAEAELWQTAHHEMSVKAAILQLRLDLLLRPTGDPNVDDPSSP
jgi:hypothetical protein